MLEVNTDHWESWLKLSKREFYNRSEAASTYLRDGDMHRVPYGKRLMQIFIDPYFNIPTSYELFRGRSWVGDNKPTEYLLLRTRWIDIIGKRDMSPTFEYSSAAVDEEFVSSTLADFTMNITAWFELEHSSSQGYDGTNFELAFYRSSLSVRYAWWSEPLPGWNPLYETVHKNARKFERLLKQEI